ncbi:hypothetical protein K437DRAFT_257302 [Tilletiaria anomala UBC 951]|uniref:Uncharacterized protein n=1 Tax=Tilletiaria anomala (strain ATCC 24038 / CBS 436.72 / UBC 951) TaxID=1037660 RepID=A0A066VYN3_TILAU|nr:uncharacterized protein K437DRAFT_257302 [Tilletiaria anomala UBC 951]KDN43909.1 hypothetical protein K437DRAFT_257302 [Tilletiaria anomala UBC 951]
MSTNANAGLATRKKGRQSFANAVPSRSMLVSPSRPPQTPTRALLERIRRRSSLVPSDVPAPNRGNNTDVLSGPSAANSARGQLKTGRRSVGANATTTLTVGVSNRRKPSSLSITEEDEQGQEEDDDERDGEGRDESDSDSDVDSGVQERPDGDGSYEKPDHTSETIGDEANILEDYEYLDPEEEQVALERQVDQLIELSEGKDARIIALEKQLEDNKKSLKMEKEKVKLLQKRTEGGGLTRQAAVKLEREFASQELILKGLQRDNESKTIEVETLRRRLRVLTDFLIRQYGESDWESVVAASINSGVGLPPMPEDEVGLASGGGSGAGGDASQGAQFGSPERSLHQLRREVDGKGGSPTPIARLLSPGHTGRLATVPSRVEDLGSGSGTGNDSTFFELHQRAKQLLKGDVIVDTSRTDFDRGDLEGNDAAATPTTSPSKSITADINSVIARDEEDGEEVLAQASDERREAARRALQQVPRTNFGTHSNNTTLIAGQVWSTPLLLSSIESVRLLIQSFEKQNALRKVELEGLMSEARDAEKNLEAMEPVAA